LGSPILLGQFGRKRCDPLLGFGERGRRAADLSDELVSANAGIQADDVLTSVNGSPVMLSSDVAAIISAMAPGSVVYLNTFRNRQMIKVSLILDSGSCVNKLIGGV
jgi:S1-C subfamily serine protease